MAEFKTNVMRTLEQKKIKFESHCYESSGAVAGGDVAAALGQNPARVFKTLVTVSKSKKYYVFLVPVSSELDLKKCAAAAGEKSVEMIHQKELLPLTGYVHGGCSPVGMKKQFPVFIDSSAQNFETIMFSAGKIGYQVELSPAELKKVIRFQFASIAKG